MTATKKLNFHAAVSIAPLVTFRIVFGLLLFVSILRFLWRGWVDSLYVQPRFHFTYTGFEWVQPLGATGMYVLYGLLALSALLIALGLFYRAAAAFFFVAFTYAELIDVTTYLNHYYFISLVAFLLIWLPANRCYALDLWLRPGRKRLLVPAWTVGILRFQLAVVYIFAGLAKLNSDWLLRAEPMRTWLPARSHLPVVGKYLYQEWVAYLFSWSGALYDLLIVFFLVNKRTRPAAYGAVLLFHIATAVFFPGIGLFPYVMMAATLIFFSGSFHQYILSRLPFYWQAGGPLPEAPSRFRYPSGPAVPALVVLYAFVQLAVPLRFLLYPGHLFWTEEGYRFSWRVMLMEKAGAAYFRVKDQTATRAYEVNNAEFLTPLQEKMMSTQPDLILKFAHFLAEEYRQKGISDPKVYAEVYVALNGERSRLFIDSTVNLAAHPIGWKHYGWVLPYKNK